MSTGCLSRPVSRLLLAGALALGGWLLAAPGASASAGHLATTIPQVDTIQVGPLTAANGFSLYVTAQDCGTSDPAVALTYLAGPPTDRLSHTYTGMRASCSVQAKPAGATLSVGVPGVVDVAVRIKSVLSAVPHPGLPVGCGPPSGPELPAVATGQIDVAIHPGVFGRVAEQTASAQIFSGVPQVCPGVQSTGGEELTAEIGRFIINADQPARGGAQLDILDVAADTPAPGLQGLLGLHMSGRSALSVNLVTGSARIGAATSLTVGSLAFTPLVACPGASAQNGTLSGSFTINDPLLGPQRIDGVGADTAYIGQGAAQPGTCNGPGSEPVEPELIDTCNDDNAGCSVQADSSVATFFEESSPGTQTITSETIDFGDGSAPVAITPGGAAEHTYAAPGTYVATLSVTDAVGSVSTATAPVVIDP